MQINLIDLQRLTEKAQKKHKKIVTIFVPYRYKIYIYNILLTQTVKKGIMTNTELKNTTFGKLINGVLFPVNGEIKTLKRLGNSLVCELLKDNGLEISKPNVKRLVTESGMGAEEFASAITYGNQNRYFFRTEKRELNSSERNEIYESILNIFNNCI